MPAGYMHFVSPETITTSVRLINIRDPRQVASVLTRLPLSDTTIILLDPQTFRVILYCSPPFTSNHQRPTHSSGRQFRPVLSSPSLLSANWPTPSVPQASIAIADGAFFLLSDFCLPPILGVTARPIFLDISHYLPCTWYGPSTQCLCATLSAQEPTMANC